MGSGSVSEPRPAVFARRVSAPSVRSRRPETPGRADGPRAVIQASGAARFVDADAEQLPNRRYPGPTGNVSVPARRKATPIHASRNGD